MIHDTIIGQIAPPPISDTAIALGLIAVIVLLVVFGVLVILAYSAGRRISPTQPKTKDFFETLFDNWNKAQTKIAALTIRIEDQEKTIRTLQDLREDEKNEAAQKEREALARERLEKDHRDKEFNALKGEFDEYKRTTDKRLEDQSTEIAALQVKERELTKQRDDAIEQREDYKRQLATRDDQMKAEVASKVDEATKPLKKRIDEMSNEMDTLRRANETLRNTQPPSSAPSMPPKKQTDTVRPVDGKDGD